MKRFGAVLLLFFLAIVPAFAQGGPNRGDLIIRADYGSEGQWADVTQRVRSLMRGHSLKFRVDNNTLGVDPRPGKAKEFRLLLQGKDDRVLELTFQENQYVDLRLNRARKAYEEASSVGLQVVRAEYGLGSRFADVTEQLNSQIRNDQLSLPVTNEAMGGDPAVGKDKILRVQYLYNGQQGQVTVNEGGYLRLPEASLRAQVGLRILRADYGFGNRFSDVTNQLNSQIRANQLSLPVTNETMGGDPAVGRDKILMVQYLYNGQQGQLSVNEGGYLRLPDGSLNAQAGLRILRADYGLGNQFWDVTNQLNSQIRNDQLSLLVTNETMGGDPAVGKDKILKVEYQYNGRRGQVNVNEGGYLRLP